MSFNRKVPYQSPFIIIKNELNNLIYQSNPSQPTLSPLFDPIIFDVTQFGGLDKPLTIEAWSILTTGELKLIGVACQTLRFLHVSFNENSTEIYLADPEKLQQGKVKQNGFLRILNIRMILDETKTLGIPYNLCELQPLTVEMT